MSGIGGPSRALVAETLPFWRSDAQPFLLYSLFWDPPGQTASTIAARFGLSREPVPKEARRLLNAEIIEWRSVGRNKVLALVEQHPATKAHDAQVNLRAARPNVPSGPLSPRSTSAHRVRTMPCGDYGSSMGKTSSSGYRDGPTPPKVCALTVDRLDGQEALKTVP